MIPVDLETEGVRSSGAAAANHVWASLLRAPVLTAAKTDKNFATALEASKACFTDLLLQIEQMDDIPSQDPYASETMSESLVSSRNRLSTPILIAMLQKLSAVCSITLGVLDDNLFTHLKLLLSSQTSLKDNLVQEAALKSIAVLVRK